MSIPQPVEIRLWWPLPLAALVWLLIIWGFGFLLTATIEETVTPPPIEARFVELPESDRSQEPSPRSPKGAQPQPEMSKPTQKAPPLPRPTPPARPPIKPKAIEKTKSAKSLPAIERPGPEIPQAAQKDLSKYADLSDYINQAKARRRAAGIVDGLENAPPVAEPQPSADELRLARIKRNLQEPGTSGIFKIINIGPRYARFSFRAWTTGLTPTRRVLIEVEAGPDGDVERAIIRRMIELIREYHQEDFNWESHRLNRVIILSARMRDNEGLEDFLMREFFGEDVAPYRR